MKTGMWKTLVLAGLLAAPAAFAASPRGFGLSVQVDGQERPEYYANGGIYVEAIRGREYALRITNPTPYRVAVALAVDGLNTIDAKHTDAWKAAKWVLGPYESTVISGWQVSDQAARRFTFTGERGSYGAFLGQTQNLGVIEAVFFQERRRIPPPPIYQPQPYRDGRYEEQMKRRDADTPSGAGAEAESRAQAPEPRGAMKAAPQPADEYAATGMGDRERHDVEHVAIDLEKTPVASVRIRYEFHPQLVKLGVLFDRERERPLDRRERSSGFGAYCPEPAW